MYETSTALDPVAAFEFYPSKTHLDCKTLYMFESLNKARDLEAMEVNPLLRYPF